MNPERGRRILIFNNYTYYVDNKRGNVEYLLCNQARNNCRGRGKLVGNEIFSETYPHNHAAKPHAQEIANFRRELRNACETRWMNQKDIYDELRPLYPNAAVEVTYATIESSMRRWRKHSQPRIPRSLDDYAAILVDPQWVSLLRYNIDRYVQATRVLANDGSISVVFGDVTFIRMISDATEIFVDATFKVVPAIAGAYQLLTFMASTHDHALPFAWALMSRKTRAAYDCVMAHIQTTLALDLRPTSFMTDFERALQNALCAVYAEATPHGCFFHYCQALYRQARSLGLTAAIADDAAGQKTLRKVMALGLLPAAEIRGAFGSVVDDVDQRRAEIFAAFFAYYERQWIGRVTPRLFSVHGLLRRTNNSVESYHRVLVHKMAPHPNIWDFTRKLMDIQANSYSDFLSLVQGREVSRTRKIAYVINGRRIQSAWRKLEEERLTVPEFLEQASYFVTKLARNLGLAAVPVAEADDDYELVDGVAAPPPDGRHGVPDVVDAVVDAVVDTGADAERPVPEEIPEFPEINMEDLPAVNFIHNRVIDLDTSGDEAEGPADGAANADAVVDAVIEPEAEGAADNPRPRPALAKM